MAVWTATPYTAVAGSVLTAAVWNAQVKDLQTAFGAWGAYTPTMTGFTLGNGVIGGRYFQVGKYANWNSTLTFGTTPPATPAATPATTPATTADTTGLINTPTGGTGA